MDVSTLTCRFHHDGHTIIILMRGVLCSLVRDCASILTSNLLSEPPCTVRTEICILTTSSVNHRCPTE
jgi:hypothetical protein